MLVRASSTPREGPLPLFYFVEEETKEEGGWATPSKGGVKPVGCRQTLNCSTLLSPQQVSGTYVIELEKLTAPISRLTPKKDLRWVLSWAWAFHGLANMKCIWLKETQHKVW